MRRTSSRYPPDAHFPRGLRFWFKGSPGGAVNSAASANRLDATNKLVQYPARDATPGQSATVPSVLMLLSIAGTR